MCVCVGWGVHQCWAITGEYLGPLRRYLRTEHLMAVTEENVGPKGIEKVGKKRNQTKVLPSLRNGKGSQLLPRGSGCSKSPKWEMKKGGREVWWRSYHHLRIKCIAPTRIVAFMKKVIPGQPIVHPTLPQWRDETSVWGKLLPYS